MSGKEVIGADEMVGQAARRRRGAARPGPADHRPHRRARGRGPRRRDRPGPRATPTPAPTCCSSRRRRREDDIERVAGELAGVAPLVFNWAEGGRTPPLSLERIAELGFALVIYPIGTLLAATAGMRALLATLRPTARRLSALPGLPRSTSSPT